MKVRLILCAAFLAGARVLAQQIDIGPAPGRLIEIGGRKLHFKCTGSGSPTVILEAGASAFALDWSLVQPEIARTNRVCSYDRAGSGWSDPRGEVDTPARVVLDLRSALAAAGEKPPVVMVGASFGGIYVRLYQLDYPDDVVGFVLVDPATEDRLFTMFQQKMVTIGSLTAEQLRSILPSTGSVPIPSRSPQTGAPFDRLSPDLYQLRIKLDQRLIASFPSSVSADVVRESSEGQRAALARLLESRTKQVFPIGDRPLVVLTRSQDMTPGIAENHAGLARLSTNSRHAVVPEAGHEIHLFVPSAVIQAIQDVSTASRQRSRLPARS
jgi:pimeloyl-ACP methyl ester carboxylesterase